MNEQAPFEARLREGLDELARSAPGAPTVGQIRGRHRRRQMHRASGGLIAVVTLALGAWLLNVSPTAPTSPVAGIAPLVLPDVGIELETEAPIPVPELPDSPSSDEVLEAMSVYLASLGITEARVEKDPRHGISFTLGGEPRCDRARLDEGLSGLLAHCRRASVTVSPRAEQRGILVITN